MLSSPPLSSSETVAVGVIEWEYSANLRGSLSGNRLPCGK